MERDQSSPTLPWVRRPALELTEQNWRGTRVLTLRIRERGGLRKVGHTTMALAQYPPSGVLWLKISSSASMATLSHTQMVVRMPKVSRWPPRGGLDSEFPSPMAPARDRQSLALCGRCGRQFGRQLLNCRLFTATPYMRIQMRTHVHIHAYTYTYTYVCTHLYSSVGSTAIRHLPTRHTVGASYLLRP